MTMRDSIAGLLQQGDSCLRAVSDSARRDAEILMGAVLERDRTYLYAYGDRLLDDTARDVFAYYLQRRLQGEPVAYIIGKREFWSLLLNVNDSTLIPRADTEVLVETALQYCQQEQAYVLDLGTGTGAVALALAIENPHWQIDAVDMQAAAVELAALNVRQLQLNNVHVYQSDWFSRVRMDSCVPSASFDLIVSNPPYIDADDPHLQQGDVRFEPRSALVANDQGFSELFAIAQQARNFLAGDGWLMLEHGYQQAEKLREYLRSLDYTDVKTLSDFGGNERVTIGKIHAGKNAA